jgi:predicted permease
MSRSRLLSLTAKWRRWLLEAGKSPCTPIGNRQSTIVWFGRYIMTSLTHDLRYGFRMLAKNPGFTAVAVLTLALGIGANSAIFTMLDAVILRPLPVASPERLMELQIKSPQGFETGFSYPEYQDLRQQVKSFSGVAIYSRQGRFVNSLDESSMVLVDEVSPDYFKVSGVKPLLGRVFSPELDNTPQSQLGVVISYRLWQGRLGGVPAIIGKDITLTGHTAKVIGVTRPHFQGLARGVPTDIWLLTSNALEFNSAHAPKRDDRWYEAVARLREGVTPTQASAELDTFSRGLAAIYPETNRGRTYQLNPETMDESRLLLVSLLTMAVPGLVLLIACSNIAGLLLARSETRWQESAVRVALGAGRWQLLRQFLAEGLLLSAAGGALGLTLTIWLMSFQRALMPAAYSFLGPDMQIDLRELGFTAGTALLATLLFTLTPALRAWKVGLAGVLKGEEAVILRGSRRFTARNVLVVGQMALSVVVMTMCLLFYRSLSRVLDIPAGFDTHKNLAVFNVFVLGESGQRGAQFLPALAERAAGLPGVKRATYAMRMLLSGSGGGATMPVSIPGYQLPEGQPSIPVHLNAVGPNYFATVGTHLLEGRDFTSADGPQSQKVVVISRLMARRFWPHEDALGKFIKVDNQDTLVVGVAEDAKITWIRDSFEPYMYLPFAQTEYSWGAVIVEASGNSAAVISLMRQEIRSFRPTLVISGVDTVHSLLDLSTFDLVFESRLMAFLSLVGVFLAAIGLYGLVGFIVRSHAREIGIRLALGAGLRQVKVLFLLRGLRLALVGVLVGALATVAAGRLLANFLYGVKPYDPLSLVTGAVAVTAIALLACYLPVRRATRVDPVEVLRYE